MSKSFVGKVCVITGAGSGMGRELALLLTKKGAKVAISDVDLEGLAETERLVRELGGDPKVDRLNVAEREAVLLYADEVAKHFGKVNQIYNNAGIAFTGEVEHMSFKDIERVMDVDFWGVVNGTKAFLPHLIASGDGAVVNTSSIFGLIAVPSQSAYNAAKFAVRGFTEALSQEMRLAGHPVSVSCVHPGGIKTNIANKSEAIEGRDAAKLAETFNKVAITTAESAAKTIVDGVAKKKSRILIGPDATVVDLLQRTLGPTYQRVISIGAGRLIN